MDKKVAHKPVTPRDVAELGGGGAETPVGVGGEGVVVEDGGVAVVGGGGLVVEDGGVAVVGGGLVVEDGGVAVVGGADAGAWVLGTGATVGAGVGVAVGEVLGWGAGEVVVVTLIANFIPREQCEPMVQM